MVHVIVPNIKHACITMHIIQKMTKALQQVSLIASPSARKQRAIAEEMRCTQVYVGRHVLGGLAIDV